MFILTYPFIIDINIFFKQFNILFLLIYIKSCNREKYNSKKWRFKNGKKKMILTSLASVTVLGAVFAVSQQSVVKADAPTATSTSGETGATPVVKTPKTEVEKAKEDLTEALKQIPDNELLDKKSRRRIIKGC